MGMGWGWWGVRFDNVRDGLISISMLALPF